MGDPNDASILKGTTLRGVQPTDEDGIATFDTLMPGHYDGRATHIHGKPQDLPPSNLVPSHPSNTAKQSSTSAQRSSPTTP